MGDVNVEKLIDELSGLSKPKNRALEALENKQIKRMLIRKIKEGISLKQIQEVLKNNQINISINFLKKWKEDILKEEEMVAPQEG